jgi:hypothetical protein
MPGFLQFDLQLGEVTVTGGFDPILLEAGPAESPNL